MDLTRHSIGDAYATALSQGIPHHHALSSLVLTSNRLSDRGCHSLLKSVECAKLKVLDVSSNALGPMSFRRITEVLTEKQCRIQYLGLENTGINDCWVNRLAGALVDNNVLKDLNLARNKLDFRCGNALGELLKCNRSLVRLDLHWNSLGAYGAIPVFEALEFNDTLVELDFSWNSLGKDSSPVLSGSLGRGLRLNEALRHIDLSYNQLSNSECETVGEQLKGNHELLGIHILGNCAYLDSQGFIVTTSSLTSLKNTSLFRRILVRRNLYQEREPVNCWVCEK